MVLKDEQETAEGVRALQAEGIAGAKALRQQPTGHAQGMQSMVSVAGMEGRGWKSLQRKTEGLQGVRV